MSKIFKKSKGSSSDTEWKNASKDLGIFEDAKMAYDEFKTVLNQNHGKDYDLWYKSNGETIISSGKPPKDIQAEEGKTLGTVTFSTKDVKNRGKWQALEDLAKKGSNDNSWKNIF